MPTHMSGGIHDELPLDGAHAVLLVLRVQLVAGDHQRVHVRDGPARRQDGVARLGCHSVFPFELLRQNVTKSCP